MKIRDALECASPTNPVLMLGAPGIGKSHITEAWAKETDQALIIDHPPIAQSVDYRGLPSVVDGEAQWLPLGTLKRICRPDCPPTVLLLDDVGQAPAPVQAALMQIVWARKLGDASLSPNVTIVLASNRTEDRSGVRPMLAALAGRVQICRVDMQPEDWCEWAVGQRDIPGAFATYPRFRPDCFATSVPDEPMVPFCTPRSLTQAAFLFSTGKRSLDTVAGWIGDAAAADLLAYSETVGKLPPIETLLRDPKKLKTKDPGLLHAVVVMAARVADVFPAEALRLGDTMGAGWAVAVASGAAGMHPGFKKTPEFRAWAVKHKELL